jgi:hypothetical protein
MREIVRILSVTLGMPHRSLPVMMGITELITK